MQREAGRYNQTVESGRDEVKKRVILDEFGKKVVHMTGVAI